MGREFKAWELRRKDAYDLAVQQAWMTVWIEVTTENKRRMPDLKRLLSSTWESGSRPQTRAEMAAALHQIAAANNLKIRTKES